ncbi:hypothetical protein F4804DRAFT_347774 [Jackrogersella minutella]|nr:hypothetical protein F4804DRAFT_347774 [Jackrogersella minutella]
MGSNRELVSLLAAEDDGSSDDGLPYVDRLIFKPKAKESRPLNSDDGLPNDDRIMCSEHKAEESHPLTSDDEDDYDNDGEHNEETRTLLRELRDSMTTSHEDFVFACGGSLSIDCPKAPEPEQDSKTPSCNRVTLRWDSPDPSTPGSRCKLIFPISPSTSDNLFHLVADMIPATFGRGGQDVLDETYRKALKLDPSEFCVDFSPYECGIIDTVAQVLLPDWQKDSTNPRGVKAELYKLNIYAGPSGRFRAHVDTPRSESQFGSLVVCLPMAYKGGQLEVRHNGKTVAFDWSKLESDRPAIQWAAFYSDCEHEVLEVRSGYRITLTYNLYAVRGNGQLAGHCNTLDLAHIPLYKHMRSILNRESFMPEGGHLGFYTTHSYPHTSNNFCTPDTLKGLDMAIWECFQALGCGVCLRPVANYRKWEDKHRRYIGATFPASVENGCYELEEEVETYIFDKWTEQAFGEEILYSDVTWLNRPSHKELQMAFTTYGNEATSTAVYSACAIIVGVPPYQKGVGRKVLETTYSETI